MDKRWGGGGITIFRRKLFVSQRGNPSMFQKIPVSNIFMNMRGRHHGVVEKSFVSQDRNEKFGKGTLLFSRKSLVFKKFYG